MGITGGRMRPRKYKTAEEAKEANRVKTRERKRRLLHQAPRPQYVFLLETFDENRAVPTPSAAKGWQAAIDPTCQLEPKPTPEMSYLRGERPIARQLVGAPDCRPY